MKVSSSSKKEPITKVNKLAEENAKLKAENTRLRKAMSKERRKTKAMRKSRDNWKGKNKEKFNRIHGLKKKITRIEKPKGHHYELNIISLCILLRIAGGCSYRSIPRILKVLESCFEMGWDKIPCANTIENWVSKTGLYQMKTGVERLKSKCDSMCLIVDENLRLGNERMLLMMLTPSEKVGGSALNYEDVEIIYMGGKKSWTGEKMEKEVKKIMEEQDASISYVLSDEDSKLKKFAKLLDRFHLPDIGHAIGNCLRKVFKKNEDYQKLIKTIGQFQSKSVNQTLTYLRPPKQRTKARFMNLKPLVKWSITMFARFDELEEKEQLFFEQLANHRTMLNTLNYCITWSEQISTSLKKEGLNQNTLKNFKSTLVDLKLQAKGNLCVEKSEQDDQKYHQDLIEKYVQYLEKYAEKYESFLGKKKKNYPVSSDVIESIFGKHKNLVSTNGLVGTTILDLELPVHCQTTKDIRRNVKVALEEISMTCLKDWQQTHSSDNQALRRKIFFKKRA